MKICRLIIKNYLHIKDLDLDLTYPTGHPKTGEPLDKVCLIGTNGTGKSNLLELLRNALVPGAIDLNEGGFALIKIKTGDRFIYRILLHKRNLGFKGEIEQLHEFKEGIDGFIAKMYDSQARTNEFVFSDELKQLLIEANISEILSGNAKYFSDLLIEIPPEGNYDIFKRLTDVPDTTLSNALKEAEHQQCFRQVTPEAVSKFWGTLIYHINKRTGDYRIFIDSEENQTRIVGELKREFDANNPYILGGLAKLWNKILAKAGLEFDLAGVEIPVQPTDNLKAYIKVKSTGEQIQYNQLSTGIRNFIFKLGHIYSLYFNRDIQKGFMLVDEPENSLFPDFLYDLVDIYVSMAQNTQIFMATHNPIIAAQFESSERVILDFDDNGHVTSSKGIAPVGDDPNDLLIKDFGVRSLLGKEGIKKWERFIELKILIAQEKDAAIKMELMGEYMEIGGQYNFSGDEA